MPEHSTQAAAPPVAQRDQIIRDFFATADRGEYERFPEFLSEDLDFRFGNAQPIHGLAGMLEAAEPSKTAYAAIRHDLGSILHDGDSAFVEIDVTYTHHDGRIVTIPAAVVVKFDDGQMICKYHVYVDLATAGA